MAATSPLAWLAGGMLLYCSTIFSSLLFPHMWAGLCLGTFFGLLLEPRLAWAGYALVATLGGSLFPPQRLYAEAFYQEPGMLQVLNDDFAVGPLPRLLGALAGALTCALLTRLRLGAPARQRVLSALCVTFCLLVSHHCLTRNAWLADYFANEPAARSYTFDGQQFIKAVHLMRRGANYYSAMDTAIQEDARTLNRAGMSARHPLLMQLFALLPNPRWIAILGGLLPALMAAAIFWTEPQRHHPFVLLGPFVVAICAVYVAASPFVIFADYWSACVVVISVCSIRLGAPIVTLVCLSLAFLFREFAALDLLAWIACCALFRRWNWVAIGTGAMVALLAMFFLHNAFAAGALRIDAAQGVSHRLDGSLKFAYSTLRFSTLFLAGRDLWMPILFAGCVYALRTPRRSEWRTFVALTSLGHFLTYTRLGNSLSQFYGFNYIPLVALGGCGWLASLCTPPAKVPPIEQSPSAATFEKSPELCRPLRG